MAKRIVSYSQGYARSPGESVVPELWPTAAWVPALGPTGSTLYDVSGRGRNGTFGAGAASPTWAVGQKGQCLSFDGGDRVSIADSAGLRPTRITLFARLYVQTQTDNYTRIVTKGNSGSPSNGTVQLINWAAATSRRPTMTLYTSTGYDYPSPAGLAELSVGWHTIAGSWDGVTCRVYYDGAQVLQKAIGGTLLYSTDEWLIGDDLAFAGAALLGLVDVSTVYSRALTAPQIRALSEDPLLPGRRRRRPVFYSIPAGGIPWLRRPSLIHGSPFGGRRIG